MTGDTERIAVLEIEVRKLRNTLEAFRLALDSMHEVQKRFNHSLQAVTNGLEACGRELGRRAGATPPDVN